MERERERRREREGEERRGDILTEKVDTLHLRINYKKNAIIMRKRMSRSATQVQTQYTYQVAKNQTTH